MRLYGKYCRVRAAFRKRGRTDQASVAGLKRHSDQPSVEDECRPAEQFGATTTDHKQSTRHLSNTPPDTVSGQERSCCVSPPVVARPYRLLPRMDHGVCTLYRSEQRSISQPRRAAQSRPMFRQATRLCGGRKPGKKLCLLRLLLFAHTKLRDYLRVHAEYQHRTQ